MYAQHNGGGGKVMTEHGKGAFLWRVKNLYGQDASKIDPHDIAQRALEMNFDWVTVKIANAAYRYNLRPPNWTDDILPSMVKALQKVGIPVWGWHYVYGYSPYAEAKVAIDRMNDLGLDGYIINAEVEYKHKQASASIFMQEIVKNITKPIGLSSYRYPEYHPGLPWKEFLAGCDYHMPQIYWEQLRNPVEQWEESHKQLKALADLPFMPTGAAYANKGWKPTNQEMIDFFDAVKAGGHPGISWWSWDYMQILTGKKETVKNMIWFDEPEPSPSGHLQAIKDKTAQIKGLLDEVVVHAEALDAS